LEGRLAGAQSGFAIVLHNYSPASARKLGRLRGFLGIRRLVHAGEDVLVPGLRRERRCDQ
jgi:hypothetical protein